MKKRDLLIPIAMLALGAAPAVTPMARASPVLTVSQPVATAIAPLPPMDSPVVETVLALRERARSGDAVAACRLAADLMLCDWLQPSRATISDDTEHRCRGLDESDLRESARWLRAAARAGHVPSMRTYAETAGVPFDKQSTRLDDMKVHREEAASMLEAAARGGSISAVHTLLMVHLVQAEFPLLHEIYDGRRDASEALSYRMLFELAAEPNIEKDPPEERVAVFRDYALKIGKLSPTQIENAEQRARQRFAAWFNGRRGPTRIWEMMPGGYDSDPTRPINVVCTDGPWTAPPIISGSNKP